MMKDGFIFFFAFFSIPKLIFWQSSYVAQYPATTITMQLYKNFDSQATFRACLHRGGKPQVREVTCLGGVKT